MLNDIVWWTQMRWGSTEYKNIWHGEVEKRRNKGIECIIDFSIID